MKKIHIQAAPFFDLLKQKNQSMWEIFEQMLGSEEQEIIFINEQEEVLFNYILPDNVDQLKRDQQKFSEEFKNKIAKSFLN